MTSEAITHEESSEPPFSDFDPFGVRQIMSVVSFRSSAEVNAQQGLDKNRGSISRMALKNKAKSSSFVMHRDYWERASTSPYLANNESVRDVATISDVSSSSCSWEEMDFNDDDDAARLFDPEVETTGTISDDGSLLGLQSTSGPYFKAKTVIKEEGCDNKVLEESIISLRLHRAYKSSEASVKIDAEKNPVSCDDNTKKSITHEFLLVRKTLNRVRGSQDEEDDPRMAPKGAASFEALPSSSTDVTSPESFDTFADSCRSVECDSRADDISDKQITINSKSDGTEKESATKENALHHEKYLRMLKVGLPLPTVIHACERDGVDPTFLQPDEPQQAHVSNKGAKQDVGSSRHTRLHWDVLTSVGEKSVWSLLEREAADLDNLCIDPTEFSYLFEEKKGIKRTPDIKKRASNDRLPSFIDPAREKNGSIVLSALRRDPVALAKDVDAMNELNLDSEQIAALSEFVPSKEESVALRPYLSGQIETDNNRVSVCVKWMIAISSVQDAQEKLRLMRFVVDCPPLLELLQSDAKLLQKACRATKESVRLRKLLAIFLSLGNRLNTAGGREDRAVAGIPLFSLPDLEQVKAFDSAKTSFLQYVVGVIERNHPEMLPLLRSELDCVVLAERIEFDQWQERIRTTEENLERLKQIALKEARRKSKFEEEVLLLRVTKPGMFVVRSSRILCDLKEKAEELRLLFDDLISYFAVPNNLSKKPSSEIIATIASLVRSVERAREEIVKTSMAKGPSSLRPRHRLAAKKGGNAIAGPKLEQMLRESSLFLPLKSAR